jgi:superfamily I DNA/RNA helicase
MHRAKGREWPRVFLLDYHARCPSYYAKKPWQIRQEYNLMYVALTRAQKELVFVDTMDPDDEQKAKHLARGNGAET